MSLPVATRFARAGWAGRAVAVSLALVACGGGSSSAAPASRCGNSSLTGVTWVGSAGWVGAGVPVAVIGYYGGWYDPVDTYDPATDYGDYGDVGDPGDTAGDDTTDTPGDDSNGDDTSGDDSSGDDSSGDSSTESLAPRTLATATDAVNGCWSCTVGCTATDSKGQRVGRQAIGVSDVSYDDACRSGVQSLEGWSHATLHEALGSCQQADASATPRVPAAPTVAP